MAENSERATRPKALITAIIILGVIAVAAIVYAVTQRQEANLQAARAAAAQATAEAEAELKVAAQAETEAQAEAAR